MPWILLGENTIEVLCSCKVDIWAITYLYTATILVERSLVNSPLILTLTRHGTPTPMEERCKRECEYHLLLLGLVTSNKHFQISFTNTEICTTCTCVRVYCKTSSTTCNLSNGIILSHIQWYMYTHILSNPLTHSLTDVTTVQPGTWTTRSQWHRTTTLSTHASTSGYVIQW